MTGHQDDTAFDTGEGLSRRAFLKAGGGLATGLVIRFAAPGPAAAASASAGEAAAFNPFVRIAPDGIVTVICKHLDRGQGTLFALTTLVAEELDADWPAMRPEFAPADAARYNNLFFGPVQGTGGSTGVANSFMQYRQAGAAARSMQADRTNKRPLGESAPISRSSELLASGPVARMTRRRWLAADTVTASSLTRERCRV